MKWSWRVMTVAGINVKLHMTFVIFAIWLTISLLFQEQDFSHAAQGIAFIFAVFAIIVLHELGHALTALHFGIKTRDITLLPIGGVARMERIPEDPRQELLIALAGPAVNLVLAGALFLILAGKSLALPSEFIKGEGNLLDQLFWVNISLALFNLLPMFPMDGGRVLRAILATRLDYVRATQIAASTGQFFAFVLGLIGLFINPFLVFIAMFVWMGATAESSMVQIRYALAGIPVRQLMITRFFTLAPGDTLQHAADLLLRGFQHDFPVVEHEKLVGMLTRNELLEGLEKNGQGACVSTVMLTDFRTAHPSEMLPETFEHLQGNNGRSLPVVHKGLLVGMISLDTLAEYLMISKAEHSKKEATFRQSKPDLLSKGQQPIQNVRV